LNNVWVIHVVGRKASCPENPRRLDTTISEEVAKESRDAFRLGATAAGSA
jgi:hypothetical protein